MQEKLKCVIWGDVFGMMIRGLTSVELTRELERQIQEHAARYPAGTGQVCWIEAAAPMPSDDVRREITALLQRQGKSFRCMVTVIEGTGFRAAALRAVVTGFQAFSKRSYPVHITGDLRSGLTWVLPQLQGGGSRLSALNEGIAVFERAAKAV